ncbi:Nucleoredoxin [Takifugu flavidus]|uniref:Nucleoredoxin n=1 Tax=Takifugu flavidus TaxID=433684 RepID=A0A5C6PDE2_9TELE|nr:Nucleoredoxin [Takifugu flavidus]
MSEFLVSLLGERLVNGEKAEVDVQALGAKLSLVGLFFGCSLNAPCKQFNGSLCEFYSRFKKASEHKDKLEIVFISSDQDQKHWQDFLQEMPWPALPFKDRHKKTRALPRRKAKPISSSPRMFQSPTAQQQQRGEAWTAPPLFHPPFHRTGSAYLSSEAFVPDRGLFPWQEMSVIP